MNLMSRRRLTWKTRAHRIIPTRIKALKNRIGAEQSNRRGKMAKRIMIVKNGSANINIPKSIAEGYAQSFSDYVVCTSRPASRRNGSRMFDIRSANGTRKIASRSHFPCLATSTSTAVSWTGRVRSADRRFHIFGLIWIHFFLLQTHTGCSTTLAQAGDLE